jgi:hypothetical protein
LLSNLNLLILKVPIVFTKPIIPTLTTSKFINILKIESSQKLFFLLKVLSKKHNYSSFWGLSNPLTSFAVFPIFPLPSSPLFSRNDTLYNILTSIQTYPFLISLQKFCFDLSNFYRLVQEATKDTISLVFFVSHSLTHYTSYS